MKRTIPLGVVLMMSVSCGLLDLVDLEYGFDFQNDSDYSVFLLMDYAPNPEGISDNFFQTIRIKPHSWHSCYGPYADEWKDRMGDSVFIYIAFFDSLSKDPNYYYLEASDIGENALIVRMTYYREQFPIYLENVDRPPLTVYFPPMENSGVPAHYYNGFSRNSFTQN